MIKIGNIILEKPFLQAPIAGYSDRAMRTLARDFGCELTFSGVILDKSAGHKPLLKKKNYLIKDDEHPIGAQLLGSEPETMATAAENLKNAGYDIIDLNFACPAPKVLRRERGGSLLKYPQTVLEIIKCVRDKITTIPVTVKLRKGFDKSSESKENFWQICRGAVAAGIDALTVHGRTVNQMFRDKADWDIIKQLRQKYPSVTIIGSGDLFEPFDCVKKMQTSGADGIAIARGAIGKPWIYRQISDVLGGTQTPFEPSAKEKGKIIIRHLELTGELYDEKKCVRYFRKFLAQYGKNCANARQIRVELMAAETKKDLLKSIRRWYGLE